MPSFIIFSTLAGIVFLIAVFPLKNWLEIRRVNRKTDKWNLWLMEMPSKESYLKLLGTDGQDITCTFCGNTRQFESLEMVLTSQPQFGPISNSFYKYSYYKGFFCSGCGTELYRTKYEN